MQETIRLDYGHKIIFALDHANAYQFYVDEIIGDQFGISPATSWEVYYSIKNDIYISSQNNYPELEINGEKFTNVRYMTFPIGIFFKRCLPKMISNAMLIYGQIYFIVEEIKNPFPFFFKKKGVFRIDYEYIVRRGDAQYKIYYYENKAWSFPFELPKNKFKTIRNKKIQEPIKQNQLKLF